MVHALLLASLFSLQQQAGLAYASLGIAVYDLDHKRLVQARNAQTFFLAASTTKLLTEGASLAFLGPQYRFTTGVYRTGTLDAAGTLNGDIVLRASGDPNLSGRLRPDDTLAFENEDHSYDGDSATRAVPGNPLAVLDDLAAQIAARGIKRIDGRVIVDDSLYDANFAEPGTGAVVSPIMVNDNIIDVTVTPAASAGQPVTLHAEPDTAYARFVNHLTTCGPAARRSVEMQDTGQQGGTRVVVVSGCVPAGSGPVLYAYDVRSPKDFAQAAFVQSLQRAGVAVSAAALESAALPVASAYDDAALVASHRSAPLSQDVKVTLKVSDNLHADAMPYLWAHGDLARAFAMERAWLAHAGLDTSQMVQNDGLGGDAFVTPEFMVRYLAFLARQPYLSTIRASLPVLGNDGTLFDIQTHSPAAGHVRAKTGTWSSGDGLNGREMITSKALAGYMTTRSGRHVAFCVYLNNYASPSPRAAHDAGELVGAIATAIYEDAR